MFFGKTFTNLSHRTAFSLLGMLREESTSVQSDKCVWEKQVRGAGRTFN